jgi:hypothetical protein
MLGLFIAVRLEVTQGPGSQKCDGSQRKKKVEGP